MQYSDSACDKDINLDHTPKLLINDSHCRIYYKIDDQFRLPKVNAYFLFETPICYESPVSYVLSDMFISMLADSLKEWAYPASLADLSYSVDALRRGIDLRIIGFNDKLFLFAKEISKRIASFTPSEDRFNIIKEKLIREYRNMYFSVCSQAKYTQLLLIQAKR